MKKVLIFLITSLVFTSGFSNGLLHLYPIAYEQQNDVFIKLNNPVEDVFIQLSDRKGSFYFNEGAVLIERVDANKPLTIKVLTVNGNSKESLLYTKEVRFNDLYTDMVPVDGPLNKALGNWATNADQTVKFSDYLVRIASEPRIFREEILSFIQQFNSNSKPVNEFAPFKNQVKSFFGNAGGGDNPVSPCGCAYVLNQYANMAPLSSDVYSQYYGYDVVHDNTPSSLSLAAQSRIEIEDNAGQNAKWYRRKTTTKGPAHGMMLRQYDAWGSDNHEYSTFPTTVSASNPNYAYIKVHFLCASNETELPEECMCTKNFNLRYQYNVKEKVIARRLKPLSKVHSVVEELAVVSISNSAGVEVLDAGRAKIETKCNGSFNFDFLTQLVDLGGAVLDVIVAIEDSTNGNIIFDISENIENVGTAIAGLASTPVINVQGDCTIEEHNTTLINGNLDGIQLKSNDPTLIALNSYTFLGTYGKRKWDNYAIARSDFHMQVTVEPGSEEGHEFCCSDKLGLHHFASVRGYLSESDQAGNVIGWYVTDGPWNDLNQFSGEGNTGFFTYDAPDFNCAPVLGRGVELESVQEKSEDISSQISPESYQLNESSFDFKLYPNPTNDFLNIELLNKVDGEITIEIFDQNGRQVDVVYKGDSRLNATYNWQGNGSLSSGNYIVVVRQQNKILQTKFFMYKNE